MFIGVFHFMLTKVYSVARSKKWVEKGKISGLRVVNQPSTMSRNIISVCRSSKSIVFSSMMETSGPRYTFFTILYNGVTERTKPTIWDESGSATFTL